MGPPSSAPSAAATATGLAPLAPPSPLPSTMLGLCDEILKVQRERALAYAAFNDGFKFYLENGAEGPYRSLMAGLTHQFQILSQRALAVESALRQDAGGEIDTALNRPDVADIIRTIQNAEKKKLELTLALQSMKSAVEHKKFSWQHGEGGVGGEHTCGSHHHHHSSAGHTHDGNGACAADHASHASVPEEPTEADIKGALKQTYTEMEACIAAINDGIAELQEILADLSE